MDSWMAMLSPRPEPATPPGRRRKSAVTESVLGVVIDLGDLADRPAPAGGLVPPTLHTGIPGLGPALPDDGALLDHLQDLARTPGTQILPEFRRTVSEWMQRQPDGLPPDVNLKSLLRSLLDMEDRLLEAQQKKEERDARKAREARKELAASDGQDDAWLNPLAHHRFGAPLDTAQSDDTASSHTEIVNLRETLKSPEVPHQLRAVFYANLLCVHLAVRATVTTGKTPVLVGLLMRSATRLLQAMALHIDDDSLGDNAAAIASELSRQLDAGHDGFPVVGLTRRAAAQAAGLPRPFRPGWFGSPDSLLLTAQNALGTEHHAWLTATAWLARDTAHVITCGLLAPQLQLLDTKDSELLDGLHVHLDAQKESLRKARRLDPDATDPYLQVLTRPMYLHRLWQHTGFLLRARHALCRAADNLPSSKLAGEPANLKA
ncbi:hypothetical protein KAK07_11865 [Ideonella sp. 4Y16]|uniref:hypothetical protein n=1 Tax=Ideonella alba TaxID=2824118 RepID=UPI001B397610|nr:hypothetical protein [Ideonella alba]MBQ0944031.1 hypothetical protein [Ideonella alba]